MTDDLAPASLTVTADLGSLVVREGTGGLKPLTDRDKREIGGYGQKGAEHRPVPAGSLHRDGVPASPGHN